MKDNNMKKIALKALSIVAITISMAQADELITTSKDWKVMKVNAHQTWGSEGCLALVEGKDAQGNKSRLEVFSKKGSHGKYLPATVQVISEASEKAYEAVAQANSNSEKFAMTLASPLNAPTDVQHVLAKLKDRTKMIELIKAKSRFVVSLKNKTGVTSTATYSLRGSSNAVNVMKRVCKL